MYPAGIFGWKIAAKLGMDISVKYLIGFDDEAKVYIGKSVYLKGVFAEGRTHDELFKNIKAATHDILEFELKGQFVEVTPEYRETNNYCTV